MTIIGALIFLTAALLGFGNLLGWWEVSWWIVAAIWPLFPLVSWVVAIFVLGAATAVLYHTDLEK